MRVETGATLRPPARAGGHLYTEGGLVMEGNGVKAAWILGGSLVLSTVLAGIGTFAELLFFSDRLATQMQASSERAAQAAIEAPSHTRVAFDTLQPVKIGFEDKLPMALRVENSMNEGHDTRAPFEVKVGP